MHCPFCGNTLSVSARICYNCGHEFRPQSDYKDVEGAGCLGSIISLIICFLFLMVSLYIISGHNLFLFLFN